MDVFVVLLLCICNARALHSNLSKPVNTSTYNVSVSTETSTIFTLFTTVEPHSTTCNSNSSTCVANSTTTKMPDVQVTSKPKNETRDGKNDSRSTMIHGYKLSGNKYCTCDLQHRFCDINCCCDKDCSYQNKETFSACLLSEEGVPETPYCKYTQYTYLNRSLYEWDVQRNGLFCVQKSNLPSHYIVQSKRVVKDKSQVKKLKLHKSSWPIMYFERELEVVPKQSYSLIAGDELWFVRNNSEFIPFDVPDEIYNGICGNKRRVKYLQNIISDCSHTNVNENNQYLSTTFYENLTAVSSYDTLNNSLNCHHNACIPLEINVCKDSFENCSMVNISMHKTQCNNNTCRNLIRKSLYRIRHNGTGGLVRFEVQLLLENKTFKIDLFTQTYEIQFLWHNYSANYSDHLSGNPGYLFGKPILIADFVSVRNETYNTTTNHTDVNVTTGFERKPDDFTKNFMVFPGNVKGVCVKSNQSNTPVEFGVNVMTKCKIVQRFVLKNKTAGEACKDIQNLIFDYWSLKYTAVNKTTSNRTVGKFGDANINIEQDWNFVLFELYPQEILEYVNGSFGPRNQTLKCYNISTTIKVDFFYSREEHKGEHNQNKIAGCYLDLANPSEFIFYNVADNLELDVPVISEVVFYDVTTVKRKKFVDPPTFKIELPFDFFYPFVKVEKSGSYAVYANEFLAIFCVWFIYI